MEIGDCVLLLAGHTAPITALAVAASGGLLASASADQTARVWELEKGQCLGVLRGEAQDTTLMLASYHFSAVCWQGWQRKPAPDTGDQRNSTGFSTSIRQTERTASVIITQMTSCGVTILSCSRLQVQTAFGAAQGTRASSAALRWTASGVSW
jgi:hypothetical protein